VPEPPQIKPSPGESRAIPTDRNDGDGQWAYESATIARSERREPLVSSPTHSKFDEWRADRLSAAAFAVSVERDTGLRNTRKYIAYRAQLPNLGGEFDAGGTLPQSIESGSEGFPSVDVCSPTPPSASQNNREQVRSEPCRDLAGNCVQVTRGSTFRSDKAHHRRECLTKQRGRLCNCRNLHALFQFSRALRQPNSCKKLASWLTTSCEKNRPLESNFSIAHAGLVVYFLNAVSLLLESQTKY
jgi:hypothetical protein